MVCAMAEGGWIGGLSTLVCATFISWFTCWLMTGVCDYIEEKNPAAKVFTIDDVAEQLIGKGAKIPCAAFVVLDLIGGIAGGVIIGRECMERMVQASPMMQNLFESIAAPLLYPAGGAHDRYHYPSLILLLCILCPICFLRSLTELGRIAFMGIIAIGMTFAAMLYGYIGTCAHGHTPGLEAPMFMPRIGAAFAIFTFSYSVTCIVPCMRKDMERPQDLSKVLGISHVIVGSLYAILCVAGYMAFGGDSDDDFFKWEFSFLSDEWKSTPIVFICFFNLINLLISLPLYVNPVGQMLEDTIRRRVNIPEPVTRYATRSTLIILGLCYAAFVPYYPQVSQLQGATTNSIVNIMLPFATVFIVIWWKCREKGSFTSKDVMLLCVVIVTLIALLCVAIAGVRDALSILMDKLEHDSNMDIQH